MASNHTKNYGFNLWAPEDSFVRQEFNENSEKTDAALGGLETSKATKAEVTALQTKVDTKADKAALIALTTEVTGKCRVKSGVYVGNGDATRFFALGFTPVAVLVEGMSGDRSNGNTGAMGGLAVTSGALLKRGRTLIEVVTGGFNVYNQGEANGDFNYSGLSYYYLVLS